MNAIKLLALDMDGTTLNSDKKITEETSKWIQKVRDLGVMVMFATGRGADQVLPFAQQLQLDSAHVLLNGSLVLDPKGQVLEEHHLEQSLIEPLYQLAQKYDTWFWGFTTKGRKLKKDWKPEWSQERWYKFGFSSDDAAVIEAIRTHVSGLPSIEITSSDVDNVEINPKGVTKATGVKALCKKLGITMNEVMAVGDSLNDYSLFKEAAVSVAMGNADPELKKLATHNTRSNDADGVAHAIQTHFFKS